MDDEPSTQGEPSAGGVFGKLPDSRPGTRSPRRGSTQRAQEQTSSAREPEPEPSQARPERPQRPEPNPRAEEPAGAREPEPSDLDDDPGHSLEDLAWAGVAAAAEAATLGVRLANRAFEALRGSSERS